MADRELLSDAEHRALQLTADLYNLIANEIVGHDPSRHNDLAEAAYIIHRLQDMLLAQAAARAYPNRYRLLGELNLQRTEPAPNGKVRRP